jgi:hypothetical protein
MTNGYVEKKFGEKKPRVIGAITFGANVILQSPLQSAKVIAGMWV